MFNGFCNKLRYLIRSTGELTGTISSRNVSDVGIKINQTYAAPGKFTAFNYNVTPHADQTGNDESLSYLMRIQNTKDGNSIFVVTGAGNLELGNGRTISFYSSAYSMIGQAAEVSGLAIGNHSARLNLIVPGHNKLALRNGTNSHEFSYYSTHTSATSYHRIALTCAKQTLSAVSGATVATTGGLIPAGAFLMGVTTRVNTSLGTSNGTTGYSVGNGTDANFWGDVTAVAAGTASKASAIASQSSGYTASDACGLYLAAQDVTLTSVGGNFDGTGAIEISAFYFLAEAD